MNHCSRMLALLLAVSALFVWPKPSKALTKGQIQRALKQLRSPNWHTRWRSLQLLRTLQPKRHKHLRALIQGISARLGDQHPMVRTAAAGALKNLGPRAIKALPQLVKTVGDSNQMVGLQAALAIGAIGPKAWPTVKIVTQHPSIDVRKRITMALPAFGAKALPILQKQLSVTDASLQLYSLQALARLGPTPGLQALLPALVRMLNNPDRTLQQWSFRVLHKMGPAANIAVPRITKLLAHPSLATRKAALTALGHIGSAGKAMPTLLLIAKKKGPLQCEALGTLAKLKQATTASLPVYMALLQPGNKQRQLCATLGAIQGLGALGKAGSSAFPHLTHYLSHPDLQLRHAVIVAIGKIKAPPNKAVAALQPFLHASLGILQTAALKALSEYPQAAKRTLPTIGRLLKQRVVGDVYHQTTKEDIILRLLKKLGDDALPAYIAGLSSPTYHVRNTSINALCAMGSRATKALPAIVAATKDQSYQVRFRAIEAIGLMGPAGRKATTAVLDALNDTHHWVRYYALRTLQTLGVKEAIAHVNKRLKDTSPFVKKQARTTLLALRALAPTSRPNPRPATRPATRPVAAPKRP